MITHLVNSERVQGVLGILEQAPKEKPLVRQRLDMLAAQLEDLLTEIERFKKVVYCRDAAACILDNGVLRILSGSRVNATQLSRYYSPSGLPEKGILAKEDKVYVFLRDYFFHAPSPAASLILQRSAGLPEWKDRDGRRWGE